MMSLSSCIDGRTPPRVWWIASVLLVGGCAAKSKPATSCPACECTCTQPGAPAGGTETASSAASAGEGSNTVAEAAQADELDDLVTSAARKLAHHDGKGCLEDLDRVAELRPRLSPRLAMTRGSCEMLVGRCQEGKARVARMLREESNVPEGRAAQQAEAIGSMYCRGGDSSDRDLVLHALYELMQGAYVAEATAQQCADSYATVKRLKDRVKPRDVEDTQIAQVDNSLYATAPACFARAGDCKQAWAAYVESYPPAALARLDPKTKSQVMRTGFDSMVERCKGKAP